MGEVLKFPDPHEAKRRIYADASERSRRNLLTVHTNRTIAGARAALEQDWAWAARMDALAILVAAAPQYERLGGDLDPWRQRPADWEGMAKAKPWEVKR